MILDRNLPDGDGLEVLALHRRTENTGAIILTGAGQIEDRVKGLDADADYHLVKPVMTDMLIAILRRFERKLNLDGATDAWILDPMRWHVTTPNSTKISLTKSDICSDLLYCE